MEYAVNRIVSTCWDCNGRAHHWPFAFIWVNSTFISAHLVKRRSWTVIVVGTLLVSVRSGAGTIPLKELIDTFPSIGISAEFESYSLSLNDRSGACCRWVYPSLMSPGAAVRKMRMTWFACPLSSAFLLAPAPGWVKFSRRQLLQSEFFCCYRVLTWGFSWWIGGCEVAINRRGVLPWVLLSFGRGLPGTYQGWGW